MCGRYRLSRRKQLVEEYFETASDEPDWNPRYNIAVPGPIFCTKWNVSVTPFLTIVRSRHRGCGDVGNAKRFPYLHAPVLA
jgi:putative SOS response-associated peptidase YedK